MLIPISPSHPTGHDAMGACPRRPTFLRALPATQSETRSRKSLFAQATSAVSRAHCQATAHNGYHSNCYGLAWALVRLARGLSSGAAQELSPMVSTRISLVLEMEIESGSPLYSS